MDNKTYVDYITKVVLNKLIEAKFVEAKYINQPNSNFFVAFKKSEIQFGLSKDRGYIDGYIIRNGMYKSLSEKNDSIANLKLNYSNIDVIVDFLYTHKDEIFGE